MVTIANGLTFVKAVWNYKTSATTLSHGTGLRKVSKIMTGIALFSVGVLAVYTMHVISDLVARVAAKILAGLRQIYASTSWFALGISAVTAIPLYFARKRQPPPRQSIVRAEPPALLPAAMQAPLQDRHTQVHTPIDLTRATAMPSAPVREQVRQRSRQTPPSVQQGERRNYIVNQGCWHIKIDRQKLKDIPDEILYEIATSCYLCNPRPQQIFVSFKDERGVDYGGPGREFLTILFKELCLKESDMLHFVEECGGFLPQRKNQLQTSDDLVQVSALDPKWARWEAILQAAGSLLAFSERMGDYPIGHVFSPLLFDMLAVFMLQDARSPFHALSSDVLLRLFKVRQGANTTIQKMYHLCKTSVKKLKDDREWKVGLLYYVYPQGDFPDYFVTNGEPDLAKLESSFELFQKSMKEQLYRQALADSVLPCVHAIACGMSRSFGSQRLWMQMISKGSATLRNTIQGSISKDAILQKVRCRNHMIDRYIRRWLGRANAIQLERLVQAATGSSRLGVNQTLTIVSTRDTRRHVVFHTCSGQVDVPIYTKYEIFKEKFDESIANAIASGFTLA